MTLALPDLAAVAAIVLFAYVVVGTTGFGASITGVPLLVHLLPLQTVVAMMVIFDLCAGIVIGGRNRSAIDAGELRRLLPWGMLGIALGATVLVNAPERALLLTLGVGVLVYAGWSLLGRQPSGPISAGWAPPIGLVGGVFGAMFGTGGPVYTIYLSRRITGKAALRATMMTIVFLSAIARFVALAVAGLYARAELLTLVPVLLPCVFGGLYLGNALHHRLGAKQVMNVVWALLVTSGVGLVLRGLG
ncbi:MAG: TSUP family transporter [Lautropia sp.]